MKKALIVLMLGLVPGCVTGCATGYKGIVADEDCFRIQDKNPPQKYCEKFLHIWR